MTDESAAVTDAVESTALVRTIASIRERWRAIAESAHGAFVRSQSTELSRRESDRVRDEFAACIAGRGGDVSSRGRAAALGQLYLGLGDPGRTAFLRILAEYQPDGRAVAELAKMPSEERAGAREHRLRDLRAALEPPSQRVFRQFNSLPAGIKFLVDLRADLLRFRETDHALARLERDLHELLASWFDIGFLTLQRITWDAPASLLERLAGYEAVHEVRNWRDLKNRLDTDRRCYAFFHPLMPDEPLIFIEIALVSNVSESIAPLLDTAAPLENPREATTAIFYSISNCQRGLAGISFGNALIKRVVRDLAREFPQLRTFSTLSPIPGFLPWLSARERPDAPLAVALARRGWYRDASIVAAVREPLLRLCAHYLVEERRQDGTVRDPVAHFHLSNGARIERINWLGDRSTKGLRDSAGMMVNYLYRPEQIDDNHEAYTTSGKIAHSPAVAALLR